MLLNVDLGPRSFVFWGRRITFVPKGVLRWVQRPRKARSPLVAAPKGSLLSARLFVGLSVRSKPTWKPKDVQRIVLRVREAQGSLGNSTILTQIGSYRETFEEKSVSEKSLQVVILNEEGLSRSKFVRDMAELAEALRIELRQQAVILEIQSAGRLVKTFFAVPKKEPKR